MSTSVGSIHYDLGLETGKFDKAMAGVSSKLKSAGDSMVNTGKTMTMGLTLPIVAGAAIAVKAASDLNENINKVEVSFKDAAGEVKNWSKTSVQSMGLAKSSALGAAALFGDMGTAMGLSTKEAAKMSMSMVQLGADLASFKNISFEEAQTALAGVFTGETESLKRLGVVMTETNLLEFARKQGITKTIQEMTQAEKVQLRYKYVMEATKNAQGDFNRTASGTANQMRITQEKFKELSATLGQDLLPIANRLMTALQGIMDKLTALSPAQRDMLFNFLAIAAVIGPTLIVLGKLTTAVGVLVEAFSGVGIGAGFSAIASFFANPVVLAVMALLAAYALVIYRNWELVKNTFMQFYNGTLKPIVNFVVGQFMAAWRDMQNAWITLRAQIAPFMPQIMQVIKFLEYFALVILAVVVGSILGVVAIIGVVIAAIARLIGWVAQTIVWFNNLSMNVSGAMNRFFVAVYNGTMSAVNWLMSFPGRVWGIFAGLHGMLYSLGVNMIQGLINGIVGQAGRVIQTMINIAHGAIGAVKRALGIRSPSRVFMGIGENLGLGMVKGVDSMTSKVQDSLTNLTTPNVGLDPMKAGVSAAQAMDITATKPADVKQTINIGAISIDSEQTADYFFAKMSKNQELSGKALTTLAGSVG